MSKHDRPPQPRASNPPVDPSEAALFEQAVEALDAIPDKDAPDRNRPARRRPVSGIRRRRPPKLKNLSIDDRLDLHQLNVEQARERLGHFLVRARAAGHRTVLVITGKGYNSPGGRGVLRREVEQWLLRHGKRHVESYAEAPGAAGGSGALVLYLRR